MTHRSPPDLSERAAGILLHLTSLPGPHGSGDLGPASREVLRFCVEARLLWWQMLPVGPVGYGDSPYASLSAFAGHPMLISLEELAQDGLADAAWLKSPPAFPEGHIDHAAVAAFRSGVLQRAFERFETLGPSDDFDRFCREQAGWLEDWALYAAIKASQNGRAWIDWPEPLRRRDPAELARVRQQLGREVRRQRFEQWVFARQWRRFRDDAHQAGVGLIGDAPIFVAHDSADVWAHPELFRLDDQGRSTHVAGVPPDYFSQTGQLWGNPLYRWDVLQKQGYGWWVERFRTALARFDAVRLDHFIGFERYWEIPAGSPTAQTGRWQPGPGADFFEQVEKALGSLPFIAEDLGAVTDEVKALRDRFSLPGLRILQFAFGSDLSAPDFKPHNYVRRTVVYTGTHDNDTTVGWYSDPGGAGHSRTPEECEAERRLARAYLGSDGREIHWDFVRTVYSSVAGLAVVPAQDLLGLGSEARMNRPGSAQGNWRWRLRPGQLGNDVARRLRAWAALYDR